MKVMMVFLDNELYGILEGGNIDKFKEERDLEPFQIIKMSESKAREMVEKIGKNYDQYVGYDIGGEGEGPIVFPDEEVYLFEMLEYQLVAFKASAGSLFRIIMEDLKLNGKEEAIIFGYISWLNANFLNREEPMYYEDNLDNTIDMASYARRELRGWGMRE